MRIELSNDDKNTIETALTIAHSMVGSVNRDYIEMYDKMRAMPAEQNDDGPGMAMIAITPLPPTAKCYAECPICDNIILGCCDRHAIDNLAAHMQVKHDKSMIVA